MNNFISIKTSIYNLKINLLKLSTENYEIFTQSLTSKSRTNVGHILFQNEEKLK